jgi:hypothetical protein
MSLLITSQPAQANFFTALFGGLFTITTYPFQLILGSTKSPFFVSQNPFVEKEWHKEERVVAGRKLKEFASATQVPPTQTESTTPEDNPASNDNNQRTFVPTKKPAPPTSSPTPKQCESVSFWDRAKNWVEDHVLGISIIGILVAVIGRHFLAGAPAPRGSGSGSAAAKMAKMTDDLHEVDDNELIEILAGDQPGYRSRLLNIPLGRIKEGEVLVLERVNEPNAAPLVIPLPRGQNRRRAVVDIIWQNFPEYQFKSIKVKKN